MNRPTLFGIALAISLGFGVGLLEPAVAAPRPVLATPGFEKLSGPLQEISLTLARGGLASARAEAARRGLVLRGDSVDVLLEPSNGRDGRDVNRSRITALGARVEATSRSWVRVTVPLSRLASIGDHVDVSAVIDRAIPYENTLGFGTRLSEAVALTVADEWQGDGWTGAGVGVAVIDIGFDGLTEAKAAGEIPANAIGIDFTGTGLESGTIHGTGVAEHVIDMAPGVQLYLMKVGDQLDFQNAADYMRLHGIRIANHSAGWVSASYYDDTGPFSAMVNRSREDDGVFWVVAAGNSAHRHWRGTWADADADGWLEFAVGDEGLGLTTASAQVCLFLNWNQYGDSVTNLDMVLRKANGVTAAASSGLQGGTRIPAESICATYVAADAPYTVAVKRVTGVTAGLDMTLFSFYNNLERASVASSMMDPAAARGAFTVGAVNQSRWNYAAPTSEFFSSQGPTNDGRMKPEITGPDGTTSFTYGTLASYGTSFAAPTTAGAAALYLQRDPSLSADELEDAMLLDARDIGATGHDTIFGSGLLELAVPAAPPTSSVNAAPVAVADKVTTQEDTAITISVLANDSDANGDVLALSALGLVANGAIVASGTSAVKFTPKANWSGTTSFTYSVSDGRGGVASALATIAVSAVNDAPGAVTDLGATVKGVATNIAVLANDLDVDGDPLSVVIVTQSPYGVASVNADKTVRFLPATTFSGTTSFSYDAVDPGGLRSRATVNVAVSAPASTGTTAGVLASDTFDSGNTLGGTGWLGNWSISGYAVLTTETAPSSSPWHVRLRASTGLAQRAVAAGAMSGLHLTFRGKLAGFEAGDTAVVKISIDGGLTWKVVRTFTSVEADGVYRSYDLDLSFFGAGSATTLRIAFDANMNATTDYWYIDDVQVRGVR